MGAAFLSENFRSAAFAPCTATFTIPKLAPFFPEGEPVFVVRGLTAGELNRAQESAIKQNSVDSVVKAIASQKDQVEQIRRALGLSSDTPGETIKRIDMLVQGCVSPKLSHADAVKLAEVCPIEFLQITNEITLLTGKGSEMVKPSAASQTTQD